MFFANKSAIVGDLDRREKFPGAIASSALQIFLATAAAGMDRDGDAAVARMIAQMAGVKPPELERA